MTTVTYTVHNYAGIRGDDRTFTVQGAAAELVLSFRDAQTEGGITIITILEVTEETP
jgi:hypothetical protein